MSSDTEITGTWIERATRSAVRWRVPVSDVGTLGLGTRWTLARAMRLASGARMMAPSILASSESRWGRTAGGGCQDDGPVHLGQLREPLGAELGVEQEAARADGQHLGPVAHDDEPAHVGLEDPVEPLTERLTGGDHRQCIGERIITPGR